MLRGALPGIVVDESRVPATGNKVPEMMDPLGKDEESCALVLDHGRRLGFALTI